MTRNTSNYQVSILEIHNSCVSDMYMEDIDIIKYQLRHSHLEKYSLN